MVCGVPGVPLSVVIKAKLQLAAGANSVPTWQSASPARLPKAESTRELIVALTAPLLVTTKLKVTLPPVSGTLAGLGLLVTDTAGNTSEKVTFAVADAEAGLPWASTTLAVTVLVCGVPGVPVSVVV